MTRLEKRLVARWGTSHRGRFSPSTPVRMAQAASQGGPLWHYHQGFLVSAAIAILANPVLLAKCRVFLWQRVQDKHGIG